MTKHEIITVGQTSFYQDLKKMVVKYRKALMTLGVLALLAGAGFGGYELYQEYQDHQPVDMSQLKYSEEDIRQIVANEMADATITELDLDKEHGQLVYDVTAYVNGLEKEFQVNATTGELITSQFDF